MQNASSPVQGYEFEQFVRNILERTQEIKLTGAPSPRAPDYGFDFAAVRDGRALLIQVTLDTPQTRSRLEQMSAGLNDAAQRYMERYSVAKPKLIVAFPGVLAKSKMSLVATSGLEVWDGPYLRTQAHQLGIDVPPYLALDPSSNALGVDAQFEFTHPLLQQLYGIEQGRHGWLAYEKYWEDLLNFLFVPPLNRAISQSRDYQGVNRRDYILPNYALDGGFWQFMREHYAAHYIVAEVKNLRGRPGKEEVLQVANYLNRHGTGLFALILARREIGESAKWVCREQWVLHNKLVVGIHDDDIRQMIETKMAGNDPAELIRQKIEDFRLGI